ncbi:regulatory protein, LacI [Pandoraea anapnoica]|uniref:Regulatory protein, LacI n=1 Tax=Pandoraea anapnoica TaxID=2508301 RepID=A0A5E5A2I8_9BURK|nr:helix-turn-helix transcriptional regulator [Pandoraea anapnoica]VVE67839.1 regulatory protein, LacI [Pandoraea anapnoica]
MTPVDELRLLREAVAEESQAVVARRLGVSRSSICMLLSGKYPGNTAKMMERVRTNLRFVHCPHDDITISLDECRSFATERPPINKPEQLRHWRACQSCPNRPRRTTDAKE